MATVTTDKQINASQLGVELGRVPLRVRHGNPTVIDAPGTGEPTLTAAVAAHVADPDWTDPEAPPPPVEFRARDEVGAIKAKARAVFDGNGQFSDAEVQKILAGLVLRQ